MCRRPLNSTSFAPKPKPEDLNPLYKKPRIPNPGWDLDEIPELYPLALFSLGSLYQNRTVGKGVP